MPVVQALADLPPAGTALHAPTSNTYSSTSATGQLANVASFLLRSSIQPSSIPTYQRAWKIFQQFLNSTFQHPFSGLPISPSVLALFIAYLFNAQYAPSTVTTYVSTLGYVHKLMGFPDPSKVFYVSQILKGYSKIGFRLDSRLPITLPILDRLVSSANSLQGSVYQMCQFQAMCSLAFYAFLRIGEITSAGGYSNPLQLSQLTKLLSPGGDLTAFKLTFGDYNTLLLGTSILAYSLPSDTFLPCTVVIQVSCYAGLPPRSYFHYRGWLASVAINLFKSVSYSHSIVWSASCAV